MEGIHLRDYLKNIVHAGYSLYCSVVDAVRAFRINPHLHKRDETDQTRILPWTIHEALIIKGRQSYCILMNNWHVRNAKSVVIPRFEPEGLLANLLHVLEVIVRMRPDASFQVDWILTGTETGFRYGTTGQDVWATLFGSQETPRPRFQPFIAKGPSDNTLWGTGKHYFHGRKLQKHRERYHAAYRDHIHITNARIERECAEIYDDHFRNRFCIGVHKRVGNWMVSNFQKHGQAHPAGCYIEHVKNLITEISGEWIVFLATDDQQAVAAFREAFPEQLIVREDVQRTTSDEPEVHFRPWESLSLSDAEDVLIDTLMLAKCNVLVHASSSVSTVASFINPHLILKHIDL